MYKLSVPLNIHALENYGTDIYVSQLERIGADRVFLCPADSTRLWMNYDSELVLIKKYTSFFKSLGYEVGVWVWAFQYEKGDFTYMKSPLGKESSTSVCPTDSEYRNMMGDFVEAVGLCGIDLFMFDDDFRYTHIDMGFGCLCDNHLKIISDILGEKVSTEEMEKHLLHGKGNKYREAFVRANGIALADFAKEMRKRLDRANPDVRMGFCSCIGSWDIDGIHPEEAAKLLAGKTKPFYRLIGAPYWAPDKFWGNRLADVIDLERIESARRYTDEIEVFSEGDTYPRPRFKTPSAYLEGFDTALRVAGCTDGILKYMFDYSAHPLYETGYISRHIKNQPLYSEIDKMFSDKKNIGVRVFDRAAKFSEIPITPKYDGSTEIHDIAFNSGARLVSGCSLPGVFEGEGFGAVAFGEHIKSVPENRLSDGLIIDLAACEILLEKGIDTGLRNIGETHYAGKEIFVKTNNRVALTGDVYFKNVELSEKAIIESRFESDGELFAGSYRYENSSGQRFLVLCFDGSDCARGEGFYRQYTRAEQIIDALPWLCGKKLPVTITGNPDLYIQLKSNEKAIAAALWNFCADDIPQPVLKLEFEPKSVNTINCSAEIKGNKVTLSRIEPFGFATVEFVL